MDKHRHGYWYCAFFTNLYVKFILINTIYYHLLNDSLVLQIDFSLYVSDLNRINM